MKSLFTCLLLLGILIIPPTLSAQKGPESMQLGLNAIYFPYPGQVSWGAAARAQLGVELLNAWYVGIQPFFGRVDYGADYVVGSGIGVYTRLYALDGWFRMFPLA
ncbi:MAG: hypothetical protein AAFO94_16000 [Bacteroidota bacterium]